MSDAKAKAEARRAKILARDKSKSVSAVAVNEEEELLLSLTESKPKERPLAARRSLIESKASNKEDDINPTDDSESTKAKSITADGGDEKKKEEDSEPTSPVPDTSSNKVEKEGSKKLKLPPKKTLEEIEKEVAENTRKFDEKTLGKKDSEKDENKESKNESTEKSSTKGKSTESASEAVALKVKNVTRYSIEPSTALRILRLFFIIALASFTGYRVMLRNRLAIAQAFNSSSSTGGDEFDLSNPNHYQNYEDIMNSNTATNRTWLQYFQYRLNNQLEAPLSAIIFIYWISKMFSPAVNAVFKVQKPKQSNPLQMIFDFLSTGLSSWMESVYTVLGEMSLYFMVLIVSVIFWTMHYAQIQEEENHLSAAPLMNNNEL